MGKEIMNKPIVPTPKTQRKLEDKCQACNGDGVWHKEGTIEHPTQRKPEFMNIKKKDIRGHMKVNIDLRKLKGSKPIVKGWEKEFEETWKIHNMGSGNLFVKRFIRNLLSTSYSKGRQDEREEIEKNFIKCLTEDFKGNQQIFNKEEVWACYNDTDLDMVMEKFSKAIKLSSLTPPKEGHE